MNTRIMTTIAGRASKFSEYLAQVGFIRDMNHSPTFHAELHSPSGVYSMQIPYDESNDTMTLYGENAYFDGITDSEVPESIQAAALEKWNSLRDLMQTTEPQVYSPDHGDRQPSPPVLSRTVESAKNGSMVQDFADMKRLGHDMKRMSNEQQLEEQGLVNDPSQ